MGVCELARIWGVSPGYVSRLKKKGMPISSLAEADQWRLDNLQKPPRTTSAAAIVQEAISKAFKVDPTQAEDDSPAARLKRAQQAELMAFNLLLGVAEGGNAVAMRAGIHAFGESQRRCSEAELALVKHQQATRVLVSRDEVREANDKTLGVLRDLLLAMANAVCVKANPSDPDCARQAVQEYIEHRVFPTAHAAETAFDK